MTAKKSNTELEAKKDQLRKLRAEVQEAEEDQRQREVLPKMMELVGTYWKYRNCYSCPEAPSDYWWIYRRVDAVRDGSFVTTDIQVDKYGELRVTPEKLAFTVDGTFGDNWIKSNKKEFTAAMERARRMLK